jgi:hypothetical protein
MEKGEAANADQGNSGDVLGLHAWAAQRNSGVPERGLSQLALSHGAPAGKTVTRSEAANAGQSNPGQVFGLRRRTV